MLRTIADYDQRAIRWVLRHRRPAFTAFLRVLTYTAWGGVWGVAVITLFILIRNSVFPEQQTLFIDLLRASIAPGLAWIIVTTLKRRWRRRRPFQAIDECAALTRSPRDDSFPSGHTASAFAFLAALSGARPEFLPYVGIWGLLIAFSRFYLGVHFLSDIAIGGAIGAFVGLLVRFFGVAASF
jgi:membrane-associated phospholipid phosphatase